MADEDDSVAPECPKCEVCKPGLPGWMATFSDMVTLLLTFFVLLLSFAKTESSKYEAALGSIRNAFGGNVLKHGEVIQRGKSADNQPTMIESQEPIRPFPIDFLTMEGILDKKEINRESTEVLNLMKRDLTDFEMNDLVDIYEVPEGIQVHMKEHVYFKTGEVRIEDLSVEAFEKLVKLLSNRDWKVFVMGHSAIGETSANGRLDAFLLSSQRAAAVTRSLVRRGVRPDRMTTVFYGDTRPVQIQGRPQAELNRLSRRVEFLLRKTDLARQGRKVDSR